MINNGILEGINTVFNSGLIGLCLPVALSFLGFRKALRFIMEEKIKDIDKKDLFNYLIQNRIFLESLTDEDIKYYKKIFNNISKLRFKRKIKLFFTKFRKDDFNEEDIEE